ncbi:hypothetical protein ACYSNW_13835 [Enterococcus sp. LJL99]
MELTYTKKQQQTVITYGETFASWLEKKEYKEKHLILLTNQRYYDLFSDKLVQLFGTDQELDWYICKNDSHCNNLSELESLLTFLTDFNKLEDFLFLGIGNEGVMKLTSFLHKTTPVTSNCWLLPLSIRAFAQTLLPNAQIERQREFVLTVKILSDQIIYDHTLTNDRGEGKLVDFLVFIRCGLVCSHDFLRMLYINFNDKNKLRQQSFNGMINELTDFFAAEGDEIDRFGSIFEKAFLKTDSGHLLSDPMKKLLGCLLQLLWSQRVNQFSFQYRNFLVWLIHLGYPIDFPEQILISDYVENIMICAANDEGPSVLKEVGIIETSKKPTAVELIETIENYYLILSEIREG